MQTVKKLLTRAALIIVGLFVIAVAGQIGRDVAAKFKPETKVFALKMIGADKEKIETAEMRAEIDEILTKSRMSPSTMLQLLSSLTK